MGVPDRPLPGKHGLAGSAMPVAKGSQGMECLPKKIYPDLPKQPRPCLSPEDEEEKDRTQRSQDCLPSENIYRRQKISPTPKRPETFRSVVDLSTIVFQDELFKKLKPSKKEKKT